MSCDAVEYHLIKATRDLPNLSSHRICLVMLFTIKNKLFHVKDLFVSRNVIFFNC